MENRMIRVLSGFQYSVNIKYDVDSPKKITSYIPTEAFVSLADEIMASLEAESTDRSRIIIGPYGTGKSHLITVLTAMLKKSLGLDQYKPLFEKLENAGHGEFLPKLTRLIHGDPYLTVILNGNGKPLEQILVQGLQKALSDAGIEGLMPRTVFSAIAETISLWEKEYPSTHRLFEELLNSEYDTHLEEFLIRIKDYDLGSVQVFSSLYPRLSAGAEFSLFDSKDVPELYLEVSSQLINRGYKGIFIVFDEFNKYLETSLQRKEIVDLKLLQDLAEVCNRSADEQVHLMLITHQHMSQYAMKLSDDLLDTWRKIEGRFTAVNIKQNAAKTYQLISTVILKQPELWGEFQDSHQSQFESLNEGARTLGLFKELSEEDINRWVVRGCYPLHPSTVFSLPRISNRLAQNERTLFTFLATKDFNTLGGFLESGQQEDFNLVTVDVLYDYFYELAQKQRNQEALGQSFLRVKECLGRLGDSNNSMAVKIMKCLGIMIGLDEPSFPPTLSNLRFSLMYQGCDEADFESSFKQLVDNKLIYERRSDGRIQFFNGSDIDFREAMDSVRGDYKYANRFRVF